MSAAENALCVGLTGAADTTVTQSNTAETLGSGRLPVFGTPALLALFEQAATNAVQGALLPGTSTVGAAMTLTHGAPTAIGMRVTAEATLAAIDGRKLTFACTAYDDAGKIGDCEQTRYVIDDTRFMEKTVKRRG